MARAAAMNRLTTNKQFVVAPFMARSGDESPHYKQFVVAPFMAR
jgi:hypothetical protein